MPLAEFFGVAAPDFPRFGNAPATVASPVGWRLPDLDREWADVIRLAKANQQTYDLKEDRIEILAEC